MIIFTCRFRCRCQCRYAHTEISKRPFAWIFSVSRGKERVSSRDEKFVWFFIFSNAYSLMYIRSFWWDFQSQQGNNSWRLKGLKAIYYHFKALHFRSLQQCGYTSDLWATAYKTIFWSKFKSTLLVDSSQ